MTPNKLLGLLLLFGAFSCSVPSKEEIKLKQYRVAGQQLYANHCSNCHGIDGKGLGKVYPPLNPSDFMDNHFDEVICIMRNGLKEEIVVNGVIYNQLMPSAPQLTDLEIAEIATYIYTSWGNKTEIIDVKQVSKVLDLCKENE